MLETERMVQEHKDRGALWVSMREREDDGVGSAESFEHCGMLQHPAPIDSAAYTSNITLIPVFIILVCSSV